MGEILNFSKNNQTNPLNLIPNMIYILESANLSYDTLVIWVGIFVEEYNKMMERKSRTKDLESLKYTKKAIEDMILNLSGDLTDINQRIEEL